MLDERFIQWMKSRRDKRQSKKRLLKKIVGEKIEGERFFIKQEYFNRIKKYSLIRFLHRRFRHQGMEVPLALTIWALE